MDLLFFVPLLIWSNRLAEHVLDCSAKTQLALAMTKMTLEWYVPRTRKRREQKVPSDECTGTTSARVDCLLQLKKCLPSYASIVRLMMHRSICSSKPREVCQIPKEQHQGFQRGPPP
jgi:hypothetical protein